MRLKQECLNRMRDVDFHFRASLCPQLALRLVWLIIYSNSRDWGLSSFDSSKLFGSERGRKAAFTGLLSLTHLRIRGSTSAPVVGTVLSWKKVAFIEATSNLELSQVFLCLLRKAVVAGKKKKKKPFRPPRLMLWVLWPSSVRAESAVRLWPPAAPHKQKETLTCCPAQMARLSLPAITLLLGICLVMGQRPRAPRAN